MLWVLLSFSVLVSVFLGLPPLLPLTTLDLYAIIGFEYGLRKVKTDNDNLVTTESFKDLDVLNNETGEYEKLSSVVNKNSY